MKTSSEGFQQCYNAQAAVDAEHQWVVATKVTANASDQGELPVVLDAVQETFDAQPETVLADAGYCNERDLTDLEKRGVDGYVALGREGKQTGSRDPEKYPATNRMAEKLSKPAGRATVASKHRSAPAYHAVRRAGGRVAAVRPPRIGLGMLPPRAYYVCSPRLRQWLRRCHPPWLVCDRS